MQKNSLESYLTGRWQFVLSDQFLTTSCSAEDIKLYFIAKTCLVVFRGEGESGVFK